MGRLEIDVTSADRKEGQIRVLVVDDDLVIRRGLVSLLHGDGRALVVGEAGDRGHALELARLYSPDVALLDLGLPLFEGLHVLAELSRICKVLVLAGRDVAFDVDQALRVGATGYLVHRQFSAAELMTAVMATAQGRAHLSPGAVTALAEKLRSTRAVRPGPPRSGRVGELSRRELEIMDHIARGRSNPEIAKTLFLSEKTVKNHVNRIYAKLQVRSRAAAVALWLGAEVDSG
ncbi:LuxR family two component transcriptional regulator [Streptomyces sp. TLI_235]|nr:response regulator transcription factor [Streptomyces sp. TLI_235]PBC69600.1 LuxR family two component transcriptional regulator [Streptomyces sp. TLI_235]